MTDKHRVCVWCGVGFEKPHGQKYCSTWCGDRAHNNHRKMRRRARGYRKSEKERASELTRRRRKNQEGLRFLECEHCKKVFRQKMRSKRQRFCSPSCTDHAQKARRYRNNRERENAKQYARRLGIGAMDYSEIRNTKRVIREFRSLLEELNP